MLQVNQRIVKVPWAAATAALAFADNAGISLFRVPICHVPSTAALEFCLGQIVARRVDDRGPRSADTLPPDELISLAAEHGGRTARSMSSSDIGRRARTCDKGAAPRRLGRSARRIEQASRLTRSLEF